MAIDFALLPEKKTIPNYPRWWIWPLLLVIFILIGSAITLYLSLNNTILNGWFLGGVFFIPLSVWLLVSTFWLYCLWYIKEYAIGWNQLYDERYAELTELGQQPLYLIFSALYTELGYQGTAQKITKEGAFLQAKPPFPGGPAIPHAKLMLDEDIAFSSFDIRVNHLFARLYKQMSTILIEPWHHYPIHVRFCLDLPLDQKQLKMLWLKQFSSYRFASISFIEPAQGSQFIDQWIDEDNEALLLVVSLHLFDSPKEKAGEVLSTLLLATDSLLSSRVAQQAILTQSITPVALHRPEIGNDIEKVISYSVLWGAKEPAELTTMWYSYVELERVPLITTQLNELGIKIKQVYHLDNTIGYTGQCAYFSAIALAAEYAYHSDDKQLIVCQADKMSASVVVKSKRYS